jgi:D-alanyl-D-alanine dipeptidase
MKRALIASLSLFLLAVTAFAKPADLVDVPKAIPGIVLDIRYATSNNFTKQVFYPEAKCYLRRASVAKLKAVQKELAAQGLGLKIFDGYRPLSVQKKFWALVPDDRYVANPAKGSRHNRGAAVDLTIIKKDGTELLMPTSYDDFTEKAHRDYKDLPTEAIKNRQLLEDVMTKHGFVGIATEWWHFDDVDWKNYDILDIDFHKLAVH